MAKIICEPSGLILNLRSLRPGDIHDILESLRKGGGKEPSEGAGGFMARRRRRQLQQRRNEDGEIEEPGPADLSLPPGGTWPLIPEYGAGTLVGEVLNRLQEAPFVFSTGPYAGTLVEGRPVDFRRILVTDVESAIYRCREAAGVPLSLRPNCGSCGRLASTPQEINLADVEHWPCSPEGLKSLSEGTGLEIEGKDWVVTLVPPTLARSANIDKILAQAQFPMSLRIDSVILTSIGTVMRRVPVTAPSAPSAGAGPAGAALDRAVQEINALTQGQRRTEEDDESENGASSNAFAQPLEIIQWWRCLDDWTLKQDIEEEVGELWGGVDSAFRWTCTVDPAICSVEQEAAIPLDLSFFGLGSGARRRQTRRSKRR